MSWLRGLLRRAPREGYEIYPKGGRWHGRVWRDGRVAYHQDYATSEVAERQTRAMHETI